MPFGIGGKLALSEIQAINDIALQPDGKLLIIGNKTYPSNSTIVIRLNTNGSYDNNFGIQGKVEISTASAGKIKLSTDGGIFFSTSKGIMKLYPSGILDTSYNISILFDNGCVNTVCIYNNVADYDFTPEGKIMMIYTENLSNTPGGGMPGYFNNKASLVRFSQNGSTDLSFGTNGIKQLHSTTGAYSNELRIPLYGHLVIDKVSGDFYYTTSNQYQSQNEIRIFKKLDSTGDPLWSFEDSSGGFNYGNIKHINGSLFSSGFINPKTHVRKLINTNPTSWEYFQINNINTTPIASPTLSKDFTFQNDGKLIQLNLRRFAENEFYKLQLVRFNTDRTPDVTFGTSGKFLTDDDGYQNGLGWCEYDTTTNRLYVATNSYIYRYNQNSLNTIDPTKSKIIIFPNPVTTNLNINGEYSSAALYTLDGRKVSRDYTEKIIDIANLKQGIYLLKGIDKKGDYFSEKIIKK